MERNNLLAVFDPAQRNLACVVYDPSTDEFVTFCMIDLKGERTTAPSSKEYCARLKHVLKSVPLLNDGIVHVKIEYQSGKNKYNEALQAALTAYYEDKQCVVEIVNPRTLFRKIRPDMKTVPKCMSLLKQYDDERKRKNKKRSYILKKKVDIEFGKRLLYPGVEFRLLHGVKPGLERLQNAMRAYDKRIAKRLKRKRTTPRRVKTRPDDILECVIIALADADRIKKRLKRRK